MAHVVTVLDNDVGSGTSTVESNTITPSEDKLILAAFVARPDSAPLTTPTCSGCGLTWVHVQAGVYEAGSVEIHVFRAMGTPTEGTVVMAADGTETWSSDAWWAVLEVDGVPTTGTNGSDAILQSGGVGNSNGVTYAAEWEDGSSGIAIFSVTDLADHDADPRTGWAKKISVNTGSGALRYQNVHSRLNTTADTRATITDNPSDTSYRAVALEIAGGGGIGGPVPSQVVTTKFNDIS